VTVEAGEMIGVGGEIGEMAVVDQIGIVEMMGGGGAVLIGEGEGEGRGEEIGAPPPPQQRHHHHPCLRP